MTYSRIVYSYHANKRIRQRGIAEFEVEHILNFPDQMENLPDGEKAAIGESNKRRIKVVYAIKENYIKIVTVM
jgi:uncharacterized DUF497 family protein